MASGRIAAHVDVNEAIFCACAGDLNLCAEVVFCAALQVLEGLGDCVAAIVDGSLQVPVEGSEYRGYFRRKIVLQIVFTAVCTGTIANGRDVHRGCAPREKNAGLEGWVHHRIAR